jgi:hypothetical protein
MEARKGNTPKSECNAMGWDGMGWDGKARLLRPTHCFYPPLARVSLHSLSSCAAPGFSMCAPAAPVASLAPSPPGRDRCRLAGLVARTRGSRRLGVAVPGGCSRVGVWFASRVATRALVAWWGFWARERWNRGGVEVGWQVDVDVITHTTRRFFFVRCIAFASRRRQPCTSEQ